jgi:hypothetical protein
VKESNCPLVHICKKEECLKEKVCQNMAYWVQYWKNKPRHDPALKSVDTTSKERKKIRKNALRAPCIKDENGCDKKRMCEILGQCVMEHSLVKTNPHIVNELRGKKSVKQVLNVFLKIDKRPVRSYYKAELRKKNGGKKMAKKMGWPQKEVPVAAPMKRISISGTDWYKNYLLLCTKNTFHEE